ncbi:MAG TPA: hypothetical protein VI457_09785 [Methylococcaceae bacterium]|nr:hypothetical protein [Methylococcaceae bacterium]
MGKCSVLPVRSALGRAVPRRVWLLGWLVVLLAAGMGWASFHVGPFLSSRSIVPSPAIFW